MLSTQGVWFPLRSNVAYFEGAKSRLSLEARLKQTAILADELFFEPGAVDVAVTQSGMMSFYHPPETLSEERILEHRAAATSGGPFSLRITPESSPGVVDERAATFEVVGGDRERGFFAEFHLLVRDCGLDDVPWARFAWPNMEGQVLAKELAEEQRRREQFRSDRPTLSPNVLLNDQLWKDFNGDLAHATVLGLPISIDSLHEPLVQFKAKQVALEERSLGAEALRILVPDLSHVPWPDIIALHDHGAIGEFRAKLIEAEETVAPLPESERAAALLEIHFQEVLARLMATVPNARKSASRIAGAVVLDLIGSAVPFSGTGAAVLADVAARQRHRYDWTTLLFALRSHE